MLIRGDCCVPVLSFVRIRLTFDWAAIGLDPASAVMEMLPVRRLQERVTLSVTDSLLVEPLKGALLLEKPGR